MTVFFLVIFQDTLDNVLACDYRLDEPEFDPVSAAAKDFISSLLVPDPEERMSAEEALGHPWMATGRGGGQERDR